jgi:large subunit ribosomal protein L30
VATRKSAKASESSKAAASRPRRSAPKPDEAAALVASAPRQSQGEGAKRLKVTQIRSGIGFDKKQSLALRGLGLRRLHHTVEVTDTPSSRGLILKVRHLVVVAE